MDNYDFVIAIAKMAGIGAIGWFVLSKIWPLGGNDYSGLSTKAKVIIFTVIITILTILLIIQEN